jgi:hypothetical protein
MWPRTRRASFAAVNYTISDDRDPRSKPRRRNSSRSALKAVQEMRRLGSTDVTIIDSDGGRITVVDLRARALSRRGSV